MNLFQAFNALYRIASDEDKKLWDSESKCSCKEKLNQYIKENLQSCEHSINAEKLSGNVVKLNWWNGADTSFRKLRIWLESQ